MGKSTQRSGWRRFTPSIVDRLSSKLVGVDVILS
jgi:hypothetical protein